MSERKIDDVLNSSWLKLTTYVLTAIVVPIALGIAWKLLDRMERVEAAINANSTFQATFSLRLDALEKSGIARTDAIQMLTTQSLRHDYEIRRLEETLKVQSAPR